MTSTGIDWKRFTLQEVADWLADDNLTVAEAEEFCRLWNAGPHFTQAVVVGGRLANDDPEKLAKWVPAETLNRCGVRL